MNKLNIVVSSNRSQYFIKRNIAFALLTTLFSFIISFAQYDIPEKPKLQTSIYDNINLLSTSQKRDLEQKLIKYSDTTSTQIVIAIINSTNGENINYLGAKWGQKWGIGQKAEDNGVLILLAKKDRKIAINTGYGVEHLLTDALSKRIIERDIIPYFKQNDYHGGLNRGADAIFETLNGVYKGSRQKKSNTNKFPVGLIFIIIFIIILISISKNKRNGGGGNQKNHQSGSKGLLEAIILSNMGRGSYHKGASSSGWGGGGFGGGFGGGGFGGGGASGGW